MQTQYFLWTQLHPSFFKVAALLLVFSVALDLLLPKKKYGMPLQNFLL